MIRQTLLAASLLATALPAIAAPALAEGTPMSAAAFEAPKSTNPTAR